MPLRRRITRRLVRAAATLGLVAAAVLAGAGTASAHAVLESTDPPSNAVLATRPTTVALTFGESVQLPPGGLRVFDPDGTQIDDGRSGHPDGAGNTVAIGVRPGSAQGSFTVAWRVISADTHPVAGAFTFSVGHPSAAPAVTGGPPRGSPLVGTLYAVTRAVAYGSWAGLVGALAFLLFCRPPGTTRSRAVQVAVAGWFGLVVATLATLVLQGPYGDGTGLDTMFDPRVVASTLALPLGSALVARLLLLVGAAVLLRRLVREPLDAAARPRTPTVVVAAVLTVGLAVTWAAAGHSAVGLQPVVALPADVAHLVAMATWLGGLAVLTLALRRPGPDDPDALARTVGRFSPVAFGSVVVLVGTGTYQSWRQLGSWSALVDTSYGEILLAKLLTVGALLAVAAVSRRTVRRTALVGGPGLADDRVPAALAGLRRTVLLETLAGVVVLALTAVLVDAEPGRTAEAAAAVATPTSVTAQVPYDTGGPRGSGTLDVTVAPARTGPDAVAVTVHDATGALTDPAELDLAFTLPARNLGPLRLTTTRQAPGRYTASGQLPIVGLWQLAITVRTSEIDEITVRVPVPIR